MLAKPPSLPCCAFGNNKTAIQFTLLQKLENLDFVDDMVLLSQKITHKPYTHEALLVRAGGQGNITCAKNVLELETTFTCFGSVITTIGGTLWGSQPLVSAACPLSGTFKGVIGRA